MGSANKSPQTQDSYDKKRTTSDYPDLNTPLTVKKQGPEPGDDVLAPINPWDSGDSSPDPMGYLPKGKK